MTTYTVKITGHQQHIKGNIYESQTAEQVNEILHHHQEDKEIIDSIAYDGANYGLTGDCNVCITKETTDVHTENKQIENWRSYGYTHDGNDSGVRCRD